jgi:glucose-1-phosphate thymidylyltransferase
MKAVIPVAGKGTRLRPRTEEKPKALVEIAGTPILSHCFDRLRTVDVEEFVVVVGYRKEQIMAYYGDAYEGTPITYVHQRDQLGLGHAVLQAEPHVDDDFILLNGDNFFHADLGAAVDRQQSADVDAVILVEEVSRNAASQSGVILTDDAGTVVDLVEKPPDPKSTLVNAGCYVLPPRVFHALALVQPSTRGEYELTDAIDLLVKARLSVETLPLDGWRRNINTEADVEYVERRLEQS